MHKFYDRNGITIYHGDCLEVMPTLKTGSFHAVVADPPFGQTRLFWDTPIPLEPLWEQYERLIVHKGAVVLFSMQPFTSVLVMSNLPWFRYEIIWEKTMPTGFLDANRKPMRIHENILVFARGRTTYNPQFWYAKPYHRERLGQPVHYNKVERIASSSPDGRRYPVSVLKFKNPNQGSLHPTQKPIDLLEYLVRTYTNEGEMVLDNALGSGTTLLACARLNREGVGVEKIEEYCITAATRLDRFFDTPQQLKFKSDF